MYSFDVDDVKEEKASANLRYHVVRKIANFFRFVEVCVALMVLSWFSTRLPVAVRISGEYFRYICVVLFSPWFVFIVGNAIILTLFAKSGKLSAQNSNESGAGTDLYDEFIQSSGNSQRSSMEGSAVDTEHETTQQGKQTDRVDGSTAPMLQNTVAGSDTATKLYQRSQSESQMQCNRERLEGALRRSETEKCWKVEIPAMEVENRSHDEEEMSDEELRHKVEAFIAKQQLRFHREESMIIVP